MDILQETRLSADLRNHYSDILKQCREQKRAVSIADNGRGDTVSCEEYKNMKAYIELLENLAGAEDDVMNGHATPVSETFDGLRAMLGED